MCQWATPPADITELRTRRPLRRMARLHPQRTKRLSAQTADLSDLLPSDRLLQRFVKGQTIFRAGDPADTFFLVHQGRIKISAISARGKEAILLLPGYGDFLGEEALLHEVSSYATTATALTDCSLQAIRPSEARRLLREHHRFSHVFMSFLLSKNKQLQETLADQLFEDSEKRLAKILLSLAEIQSADQPGRFVPKITHETLAEMVGTTRPRVSFFMNRFRKLGFIEHRNKQLYVIPSLWHYVHKS